jgi:SAM-dependent methyltransferase
MIKRNTGCRICKNEDLTKFLEFGPMPHANGFLDKDQLNSNEPLFPVNIYFCKNCGLVQLADIVPKEVLFSTYPYFSSVSDTFKQHCEELAREIAERFIKSTEALVVEIGSNDGVLLKPIKRYTTKTLGIEPATNVAQVAQSMGVDTIIDFFSKDIAENIVQTRGKADIILALNVFNHLNDLDDVMEGIQILLADDGIFIIEVPYLLNLITKRSFDTMYHEMHSYFSIKPLLELFKQFRMEIFDVRKIDIHTGSIRVYVRKTKQNFKLYEPVSKLIEEEEEVGLYKLETYFKFAAEVVKLKNHLIRTLNSLKAEKKRIIGYGAAAKGNVLLNYCRIGIDILDYIVDATPWKQGLYTPGMHIPVYPVEKFRSNMPDYILILPWNFAEEIMNKEPDYKEKGGKFIIPLPELKII